MLGEHSADVLQSWLGLGEREIEGLAADKVITRRMEGSDPMAIDLILAHTA